MLQSIETGDGEIKCWVKRELSMGQAEAFLVLQEDWVNKVPEGARAMRLTLALCAIGVESWVLPTSFAEVEWPELWTSEDNLARIQIVRQLSITQAKEIAEAISARMFITGDEGKESGLASEQSTDSEASLAS